VIAGTVAHVDIRLNARAGRGNEMRALDMGRGRTRGHHGHIMIRFLFRFAGLFLLAGGFVALVYDGTKTIAGNAIYVTRLSDTWNAVHSTSLQALEAMIKRHGEWLWNPVMLYVLPAPAWLVLAILGAVLIVIGRKKKALIGYARD
jgi:hypothetical protein